MSRCTQNELICSEICSQEALTTGRKEILEKCLQEHQTGDIFVAPRISFWSSTHVATGAGDNALTAKEERLLAVLSDPAWYCANTKRACTTVGVDRAELGQLVNSLSKKTGKQAWFLC